MSVHDSVGDFLTQIRNAYKAERTSCSARHSNLKESILSVLLKSGYVASYRRVDRDSGSWLDINLKYLDGQPALCAIDRVSKPGRRVYAAYDKLPKVLNGMGIAIVSTSEGVLAGFDARKKKVGGEVICSVY